MLIGIMGARIKKIFPSSIGYPEKMNEDYYIQVEQYYFMLGVPWFPTRLEIVLRHKNGEKFPIPNEQPYLQKVAELKVKIKSPIWCYSGPILGAIGLIVVAANYAFNLELWEG